MSKLYEMPFANVYDAYVKKVERKDRSVTELDQVSKRYMIFVIDDLSGSGTAEEMVAIDAFNDGFKGL
jgi:hypothetical protein